VRPRCCRELFSKSSRPANQRSPLPASSCSCSCTTGRSTPTPPPLLARPPPAACPASASSIDTPRSHLAAVLCGARYPFAVQLPCQQQRKQSLSRTLTTLAHGIRSSAPPCLSRKHPPSPNRPRATPLSRPRVIRPKCTSLP
jgi:hypothetical protein